MCRMIIASGNVDLAKLFEGLINMAKDETKKHEFNKEEGVGSFVHDNGWGMAYINEEGEWVIEKSIKPIFNDSKVDELKNIKTKLVILHTRKATQGDEKLENTHPFYFKNEVLGEFVMCHNGSVRNDIKFSDEFKLKGNTDSEKIFYSILGKIKDKEIPEAIRLTLLENNYCKGTNIILATKNSSYIAIKENIRPTYYNMHLAKTNEFTIMSSESFPYNNDLTWEELIPGTLLTLDNNSGEITIQKIEFTSQQNLSLLGSWQPNYQPALH